MVKSYTITIIGTGIAGLSNAIYLAETAKQKNISISILVIAKEALNCTNTNWAQGGIAAVGAKEDNFEQHIQDTLNAGVLENDPHIVQKVVHAAPGAINDLMRWGVNFDKQEDGQIDLAKEGGHQFNRIYHHTDATGLEVQSSLLQKAKTYTSIELIENAMVCQLSNPVEGTFYMECLMHEKSIEQFHTQFLVIATGGLGVVYGKTTNQHIATGDGIGLSLDLNIPLRDISYIQFHPTGLYDDKSDTTFLITEALRGAGAILRNNKGEDFTKNIDVRGSLAPRDIISRAIEIELKKTGERHVYLDATLLSKELIEGHFPNIQQKCKERLGIDLQRQWIPVTPVEHYACGGIKVDEYGQVEGMQNLFAIGEVASTGLHGANRLASNSLLEGQVFAKFAAEVIASRLHSIEHKPIIKPYLFKKLVLKNLSRHFLQNTMLEFAGIEKSTEGLNNGLKLLDMQVANARLVDTYDRSTIETNWMYSIGIEIFKDALSKTKNVGVFYNIDL